MVVNNEEKQVWLSLNVSWRLLAQFLAPKGKKEREKNPLLVYLSIKKPLQTSITQILQRLNESKGLASILSAGLLCSLEKVVEREKKEKAQMSIAQEKYHLVNFNKHLPHLQTSAKKQGKMGRGNERWRKRGVPLSGVLHVTTLLPLANKPYGLGSWGSTQCIWSKLGDLWWLVIWQSDIVNGREICVCRRETCEAIAAY